MPIDASKAWYPNLFQKQLDVFNSYARALLVPGPRLSGKTRAVCHKVCRHLWETDGARVGMFSRTLKAKDGGTWSLLTKSVIPEWIKSGIGFQWTTDNKGVAGPKTDGITRTPFFRVRNMHGTESELLLFSLDDDNDVESKLKEMEFSMIYFSELDKFGDRRVLTVALPSLRMGHLKFEDQQWIADCNPAEEGEESWIYKLFFLERNMSYDQHCAYQKEQELPVFEPGDFRDFFGQLEVIEILPRDNTFIDPRQLQEVKVACGSDQGLYARLVEGKWVWGGGDKSRHFRSVFKEHMHVIGEAESHNEEDWIVALPSDNCWELITGWDLGETNHAQATMENLMINGRAHFVILDELVSVGKEISNEDFTIAAMEQIELIEKTCGKQFQLTRNWSDRSSIEKYSAAADTYPHLQVHAASKGRITLEGVPKPAGSVNVRVMLVKQLLAQKRLKVSAHCKHTIRMFKDLRRGSGRLDFIPQGDDNKHIFDALSYPLLMECIEELHSLPDATGKRSYVSIHI